MRNGEIGREGQETIGKREKGHGEEEEEERLIDWVWVSAI